MQHTGVPEYSIDNIFSKVAAGLTDGAKQKEYLNDPRGYLELFGHPWQKQVDMIKSVRDNKITTVRSCNDVGKTWTAAALVLWWMDVYRPNCKVISTAKNFTSVQFMLWTRIRQQHTFVKDRFGGTLINQTNFQPQPVLHPDWFAIGYNPKIEGSLLDPESEATAFQGHHSKHTLFLIDEAMTTHPSIFRAIEGSLLDQGSRLIAIFNPTNTTGGVVDYETDSRTNSIVISSQDLFDSKEYKEHPEHYAELASPESCQKLIDTFGRNSAIVKARIFAEYPDQDEQAAIDYEAITRAQSRESEFSAITKVIYSWDVAGEGSDANVLGRMTVGMLKKNGSEPTVGMHYQQISEWKRLEHTASMKKVYEIIKDAMDADPAPDHYLVVDSVGEGSHVPSFMNEWLSHLNVVAFKGGAKAKKVQERREMEIFNAVSEAWYLSHLLLEEKIIGWPKISMNVDKQTEHELSSRKHELKIKAAEPQVWAIEKKDAWKIRNRNKSPDKADAFVMAVYCHFRSVVMRMVAI